MPHTQLRAGSALAALALGACLVVAPAPAEAALPSKHTVYKGDGSQAGVDTTVTFKLKVGDNSSRFKKATVNVHCPTDSNKVVFKNVKIDSGGNFEKTINFSSGGLERALRQLRDGRRGPGLTGAATSAASSINAGAA
jgi:hypothetical protein